MNLKEVISKILESYPETIENDKMLCYKVYEKIAKENGETIWIPFNLFKLFPAFETISRIRRKLNEEKEKTLVKKGYVPTRQMSSVTYPNSWMSS